MQKFEPGQFFSGTQSPLTISELLEQWSLYGKKFPSFGIQHGCFGGCNSFGWHAEFCIQNRRKVGSMHKRRKECKHLPFFKKQNGLHLPGSWRTRVKRSGNAPSSPNEELPGDNRGMEYVCCLLFNHIIWLDFSHALLAGCVLLALTCAQTEKIVPVGGAFLVPGKNEKTGMGNHAVVWT